MSSKKVPAVAYYRTSSATNVGDDKDSHRRRLPQWPSTLRVDTSSKRASTMPR